MERQPTNLGAKRRPPSEDERDVGDAGRGTERSRETCHARGTGCGAERPEGAASAVVGTRRFGGRQHLCHLLVLLDPLGLA
ncbi:MAG: hypothetical protein E6G42_03330 [Actinobacteria bacterium]|nr:MAG: hypothetical protein E6G42_03330 [Actinomycetota bacterium]